MIYRLRKKLILISTLSFIIVFTIIFACACIWGTLQLNRTMDTLADTIIRHNGVFPDYNRMDGPPKRENMFVPPELITRETKFSTRFFTVRLDDENNIVSSDTRQIFAVDEDEARNLAAQALKAKSERGWISEYRYAVRTMDKGKLIVFIDGSMNRMMTGNMLLVFLALLLASTAVILFLIILFSGRAVKPVAESYEKQKQFVTDASHELKTPLTLILANADIVEAETGSSEWIDDIRSEGRRMGELIGQMVTLSRMDEDNSGIENERFDLSCTAEDVLSEFAPLAEKNGVSINAETEQGIFYNGDERLVRQLLSILLDNAVKYCDKGGEIIFKLSLKHRNPVIKVENTFSAVGSLEINRLFDRFYRADKARTASKSFGIGLSIAKSIALKHRGDISAYKKSSCIGFKVVLK